MKKNTLLIIVLMLFALISNSKGQDVQFPPTPNENELTGKNDNCYLAAIGHPTKKEQKEFIDSIKPFIDSISKEKSVPRKTILAMAILESGYGFTRIGYYANNLFGMKVFTKDSTNFYALKGQPDEDGGKIKTTKIIKKTKNGGLIFDETSRIDNRYRKFDSRQDCISYLVNNLLQNSRYKPVVENYQKNITNKMAEDEASLVFAFELAEAGYNHLGGKYYRKAISNVITKEKL